MALPGIKTFVREHFVARLFLVLTALIVVISLVFTGYFYRSQKSALTDRTMSKGELLASLLAQSVRLGVFAEDPRSVATPVADIFRHGDIHSVDLYTATGRHLVSRRRDGTVSLDSRERADVVPELLKGSTDALHFDEKGNFVFWKQIVIEPLTPMDDVMYFGSRPQEEKPQLIGFVRIVIDGHSFYHSLESLLVASILIAVASLVLGTVIAYFIAAKVTRPLDRLARGVATFGRGDRFDRVEVTSADEFGRLAAAFNRMVDSLETRQSEKEELEMQLRQAQKMEAVGRLAGGIAHDFNNILTAILGFGSMLRAMINEGDQKRVYVDQIVKAGERATTLTQRLLAFSRKQMVSPTSIDLNRAVIGIRVMLERLIKENIRLNISLCNEPALVVADAGQLDQILINLVTNACDAMPAGGGLTISTGVETLDEHDARLHDLGKSGRYAVLTVADTGIGMSDEVRERIFEPFYTSKGLGKGTGLGLFTVYGIVRTHGGNVEVDSEYGRGTTFRIYLPLAEPSLVEVPVAVERPSRGNAETILVAEDDEAVMDYLCRILVESGYRVIAAKDGEEAIEKFNSAPDCISLALLDVIMPGKNGNEVCAVIAGARPDIKVIYLSGYTHEVFDGGRGFDHGEILLSKPVRPDELLGKVRELLAA